MTRIRVRVSPSIARSLETALRNAGIGKVKRRTTPPQIGGSDAVGPEFSCCLPIATYPARVELIVRAAGADVADVLAIIHQYIGSKGAIAVDHEVAG